MSRWRLSKRRSVPPYGPDGSERTFSLFLTYYFLLTFFVFFLASYLGDYRVVQLTPLHHSWQLVTSFHCCRQWLPASPARRALPAWWLAVVSQEHLWCLDIHWVQDWQSAVWWQLEVVAWAAWYHLMGLLHPAQQHIMSSTLANCQHSSESVNMVSSLTMCYFIKRHFSIFCNWSQFINLIGH